MTLHFSHNQEMEYGSQGETEGYFQDNSSIEPEKGRMSGVTACIVLRCHSIW
jgi:hypothetical protein